MCVCLFGFSLVFQWKEGAWMVGGGSFVRDTWAHHMQCLMSYLTFVVIEAWFCHRMAHTCLGGLETGDVRTYIVEPFLDWLAPSALCEPHVRRPFLQLPVDDHMEEESSLANSTYYGCENCTETASKLMGTLLNCSRKF